MIPCKFRFLHISTSNRVNRSTSTALIREKERMERKERNIVVISHKLASRIRHANTHCKTVWIGNALKLNGPSHDTHPTPTPHHIDPDRASDTRPGSSCRYHPLVRLTTLQGHNKRSLEDWRLERLCDFQYSFLVHRHRDDSCEHVLSHTY